MEALSDNALMLKVKSGEHQTLGLLYERYKKRLFGFFFQMNKNAAASEDLVQNVFIRILKYKHTFHEDSKFITWMFQIARNLSNDHFKNNGKSRTENVEEVGYKLHSEGNVESDIESSEKLSVLQRALNTLPIEKKELIMLSKLKELKYKEVGEIVGCTEGNARIKVHRALNDLKAIYLTLEKQ